MLWRYDSVTPKKIRIKSDTGSKSRVSGSTDNSFLALFIFVSETKIVSHFQL